MKHDNIDSIISKIFRGNAVLFVGAGFSKGAISFDGCMPVGDKLKQKILSRMNKESESIDLKTAADYFVNKHCKDNPDELDAFIEELKNIFTCKKPQEHHISIVSAPWKHIYTTNYRMQH